MNPKVSIIMATYNRAKYIVESLKSIQNQTYESWECLIIDDGATDNTKEIIDSILTEDKRFQFLQRPDSYKKGLPGSRNYGLDLAQGDYIIFFDDDDIAHPQNLEICVKELSNSNISFCRYIREVFKENFDYSIFDYSKTYSSFYIDKKDINKILKNELQFNSCAIMWKKVCFEANKFEESLMYAEEWELYSRIVSLDFIGKSVNKTLFYGRKHSHSNTGEFYKKNKIRRKSNSDAIVLVMSNLRKSDLLSNEIIRYFIQVALDYKEYKLYNKIMNTVQLSSLDKLKWKMIYLQLPLRLFIYGYYKKIKK